MRNQFWNVSGRRRISSKKISCTSPRLRRSLLHFFTSSKPDARSRTLSLFPLHRLPCRTGCNTSRRPAPYRGRGDARTSWTHLPLVFSTAGSVAVATPDGNCFPALSDARRRQSFGNSLNNRKRLRATQETISKRYRHCCMSRYSSRSIAFKAEALTRKNAHSGIACGSAWICIDTADPDISTVSGRQVPVWLFDLVAAW